MSAEEAHRRSEEALLQAVDWETAAIFDLSIGEAGAVSAAPRLALLKPQPASAGRSTSVRPVYPGDEPLGLSLTPVYDWMSTLGAEPTGIYLKVLGTEVGAAACGLAGMPLYDEPVVACVRVSVVNKTGLDLPSFLLEAFSSKEETLLPAYAPPAAGQVHENDISGELVGGPSDIPGPLWVAPAGEVVTLAFPFGEAQQDFMLRVMIQREICDNGKDDDLDGRVDEACGSVASGGACVIDLDCASGECAGAVCAERTGRWVTLGVYEVDWAALNSVPSDGLVVETRPIEAWPADFVPADDKSVYATRLLVSSVGFDPTECDLVDGPPYEDRVVCPSLVVQSVDAVAETQSLFLEFLADDGALVPFTGPYQPTLGLSSLARAAQGRDPVAGNTFPFGPPHVPERSGNTESGEPGTWGNPSGHGFYDVLAEARELCPALELWEPEGRLVVRVVVPELPDRLFDYNPPGSDPVHKPGNPIEECNVFRTQLQDPEGTGTGDTPIAPRVQEHGSLYCHIDARFAPDVYNVVTEFGQIMSEIGWSAEYLTNEFVAQSYGEADALAYVRGTWGDERLEEAFPGFVAAYDGGEGVELATLLLSQSDSGWVELLRPDRTGRYDSYWGLRALAEHGSLAERGLVREVEETLQTHLEGHCDCSAAIAAGCPESLCYCTQERVPEGACESAPTCDEESCDAYASCAQYVSCAGNYVVDEFGEATSFRAHFRHDGAAVPIPRERMYVLPPGGTFVVRQAASAEGLWPYHGPLPDVCSSLPGTLDPTTTEEPSRERTYSESMTPDARYGWPRISFYGWSNVELNGCGASIEFRPASISEPSTNPFSGNVPADVDVAENQAWIPACIDDVSGSDSVIVKVAPAYVPQSIVIEAADNVTIRDLELRTDVDRLRTRYDGLTGTAGFTGSAGYDVSQWPDWNDIAPYYTGSDLGGLDTDHDNALCKGGGDVSALRESGATVAVSHHYVTSLPSALAIGDSNGVVLHNVRGVGAWDGLRLGDNNGLTQCVQRARRRVRIEQGKRTMMRTLENLDAPILQSVSSGRVHLAAAQQSDQNRRWPRARLMVAGLCDRYPCPVSNVRVVDSYWVGRGRNSASLGHVRHAVIDGTTFTHAGRTRLERPLFYSGPGQGADVEPGDASGAVRVNDQHGSRARLIPGQINFVNSVFRDNLGGALSVYSNVGAVEQVRILSSDIFAVAAEGELTTAKSFVSAASSNVDFVCNSIRMARGSNLTLWHGGGSGTFSHNHVQGSGDLTFGAAASGCGSDLLPANETVESLVRSVCAESESVPEYSGGSPYPRCEDLMVCGLGDDDYQRVAIVRSSTPDDPETLDVDESLTFGETVDTPRIDVPWVVSAPDDPREVFAESQFRIVTNNRFLLYASNGLGGSDDVQGDSIHANVDRFRDNSVCFIDRTSAGTTSGEIVMGAPMVNGSDHDTELPANYGSTACADVSISFPELGVPPSPTANECRGPGVDDPTDELRAWMLCNCNQNNATLLVEEELLSASGVPYQNMTAARNAFCESHGYVDGSRALSLGGGQTVPAVDRGVLRIPAEFSECLESWHVLTGPAGTPTPRQLSCWEDVAEIERRGRAATGDSLSDRESQWQSVAGQAGFWQFPADRYGDGIAASSDNPTGLAVFVDEVQ